MFRFPKPNSRSFALFIINTFKLPNSLNDPLYLLLLATSWGVKPEDMFVLIDSSSSDQRFNILKSIIGKNNVYTCFSQGNGTNFVNLYSEILSKIQNQSGGAQSSLFISISGHGSQIKDATGDEVSGMDDCILPGGVVIRDDSLKKGLEAIKNNFTVLTASDTCHSGTMFDFEWQLTSDLSNQKEVTRNSQLSFDGLSLSACSDNQVDYEVGANATLVGRYLPKLNLSASQVNTYISLLRNHTTTGALTSKMVDTLLEEVNMDRIKNLQKELKDLGQDCTICKTLPLKIRDGSVTLSDVKNSKILSSSTRDTIQDDPPSSSPPNNGGSNTSLWWILGVFVVCLLIALIFYSVYYSFSGSRRRVGNIRIVNY